MKQDLKTMTEAALIDRSRSRPWERQLEGIGCVAGLILSVCAAVGTLVLLGFAYFIAAIIAFFAVSIAFAVLIFWVAGFRSRPYRKELKRRYHLPELPASSAEAEPLFAGSEPPDAVLLLSGRGLPHGNDHFVQVTLWQGEMPRGTILARTLSRFDFDRDVPFTAALGEAALTGEERAAFWALLPEAETASTEKLQDVVIDGFPCRLVALRREPFQIHSASCNLAGIGDVDAAHPVPAMMQALLAASRRAGMQPAQYGGCDPYGNIGIAGTLGSVDNSPQE
jgi:hypothetical protein